MIEIHRIVGLFKENKKITYEELKLFSFFVFDIKEPGLCFKVEDGFINLSFDDHAKCKQIGDNTAIAVNVEINWDFK